jgi:hypothetical protein
VSRFYSGWSQAGGCAAAGYFTLLYFTLTKAVRDVTGT